MFRLVDAIPGWIAMILYLAGSAFLFPISYWLKGSAAEQLGAFFAAALIWLLAFVALPLRSACRGSARMLLLAWPLFGVIPALLAVAIYYAGDDSGLHWINFAGVLPMIVVGMCVVAWFGRLPSRAQRRPSVRPRSS